MEIYTHLDEQYKKNNISKLNDYWKERTQPSETETADTKKAARN